MGGRDISPPPNAETWREYLVRSRGISSYVKVGDERMNIDVR
jgi:hypothetical protein